MKDVDARHKAGHDGETTTVIARSASDEAIRSLPL